MRIDLLSNATSQIANERCPKQVLGSPHAQASEPMEDTATLSTDSVSISALADRAMQTPEIRQDRVDALRQAISAGDYKIDPLQIAGSILSEKA
jgi:flagellar biosynthesis anti-sigma factor FlgM